MCDAYATSYVVPKVSDGISMGLGDYFSAKSEKDYILQGACPRQPAPQLDLRFRTTRSVLSLIHI